MKRFLSVLLCTAMLITAVPGMYYAQGFGSQTVYAQEKSDSDIQEIDYQLKNVIPETLSSKLSPTIS